ncbi:hypothetical protein FJZ31_43575 [Candidatus Poribacteria bacterium]|nr:hypothetical protein [Candidatus Poribacteria bacterium]
MMETILVELPQPIVACLIKEARQKKMSVSELVAQRINRDFSFAVRTAQQARRKALKILREHAGYLLRTGKPTFDIETERWHVPALTNPRKGIPVNVGEVIIAAESGEVLTDLNSILSFAEEAGLHLGIEKFPEAFQERISFLLAKNNNGELTADEKRELNEMMEFFLHHPCHTKIIFLFFC